jgi:hypothetical protein
MGLVISNGTLALYQPELSNNYSIHNLRAAIYIEDYHPDELAMAILTMVNNTYSPIRQ